MANAIVRGSLFWVGVLCALAVQAGGEATHVIPGSKAAKLERCVIEPTNYMRRNHMEVIKHQRGETVHNGIRATEYSLAGCIECHVSYAEDASPIPVNAEGQFCHGCHEFAAVDVDCFGCHASIPSYAQSGASEVVYHEGLGGHPSSLVMSAPRVRGPEIDVWGGGK